MTWHGLGIRARNNPSKRKPPAFRARGERGEGIPSGCAPSVVIRDLRIDQFRVVRVQVARHGMQVFHERGEVGGIAHSLMQFRHAAENERLIDFEAREAIAMHAERRNGNIHFINTQESGLSVQ